MWNNFIKGTCNEKLCLIGEIGSSFNFIEKCEDSFIHLDFFEDFCLSPKLQANVILKTIYYYYY